MTRLPGPDGEPAAVADDEGSTLGRVSRIESNSVVGQAYEAIRDAVLNGTFGMGDQLVEARLAEDLGISRGPLREALRRLHEQGLVEHRPRFGTFVREFGVEDVVHICNTRMGLETVVAREIVRRSKPVRQTMTFIEEMRSAAAANDRRRFVECDLRFHAGLCEASGNGFVVSSFTALSGQIRIAMTVDDVSRDDLSSSAERHLGLLEILERDDERAAAAAVQEHIYSSVSEAIARRGGDVSSLQYPLATR